MKNHFPSTPHPSRRKLVLTIVCFWYQQIGNGLCFEQPKSIMITSILLSFTICFRNKFVQILNSKEFRVKHFVFSNSSSLSISSKFELISFNDPIGFISVFPSRIRNRRLFERCRQHYIIVLFAERQSFNRLRLWKKGAIKDLFLLLLFIIAHMSSTSING